MHLVLDSSVLIAALKPTEASHADAHAFIHRLRAALTAGTARAFAPPELWLEVHVAEQRLSTTHRSAPPAPAGAGLDGLAVELLTLVDAAEITTFLALLTQRMRGRKPFANATDLVYLWAAHRANATVVTLDEGLLRYHRMLCDVTRPQHVRLP